jgi:hypothetical protein
MVLLEGCFRPWQCNLRSAASNDRDSHRIFFSLAVVLVALVVRAASANDFALSPSQPQQDDTIAMKAAKSGHGQSPKSDPALLGRTDSTLVHVLVKLDYDAVASYEGNIPGLAATSPQRTGKKLKQNKAAVDAYTGYIMAYEARVLGLIKASVPDATVRRYFRTAYGGVAMTLPANRIGDLLSVAGVVAVQQDSLEHPR